MIFKYYYKLRYYSKLVKKTDMPIIPKVDDYKDEGDFKSKLERFKKLDNPEERLPTEKDIIIDNPLEVSGYLNIEKNEYLDQDGSYLRVEDNDIKLILESKKFDITDKKIKISNLDNSDILHNNPDIVKLNLGNSEVLEANTISLEDLDVNNIPYDINIQLEKNTKSIEIIGNKIDDKLQDNSDTSNNVQNIEELIEEKTFDEYRAKNLNFLENYYAEFDFFNYLKYYIRYAPILLLAYYYIESFMEIYKIKSSDYYFDNKQLELINNIKYSNK